MKPASQITDRAMRGLARDLTYKYFGPPLFVGAVVSGPRSTGGKVRIIAGQFMGEFGLSNFWYWRSIRKDGTMYGPVRHGYGWTPKEWKRKRT